MTMRSVSIRISVCRFAIFVHCLAPDYRSGIFYGIPASVLDASRIACASFRFLKSALHKETMLNQAAYSSRLKKIVIRFERERKPWRSTQKQSAKTVRLSANKMNSSSPPGLIPGGLSGRSIVWRIRVVVDRRRNGGGTSDERTGRRRRIYFHDQPQGYRLAERQ